MEKKLTEQFASNEAIDILASAIIALPGGADALESAVDAKLFDYAERDGEFVDNRPVEELDETE